MTVSTPDNATLASEDNGQAQNQVKRYPVICIDGPSGAGKGTAAWRLAKDLEYQLLDSGALYRIVGLKAFESGLISSDATQPIDEAALLAIIDAH